MKPRIRIVVRAVIIKNKKILLCRMKREGWYFLPGGGVEFAEDIRHALLRELKEELGIRARRCSFLGFVENFFRLNGRFAHELNILVRAEIGAERVNAVERHIEFEWIPINEFSREHVLPRASQKAILKWLKDKKPFFATEPL